MEDLQLPLTGILHEGNYVWAIGMNLAWNQLVDDLLGGQVTVDPADKTAMLLVQRFNSGTFTKALLEEAAYFVRAGEGPRAVEQARQDLLREKEVKQSMLDSIKLKPGELFSYARVEKMLQWKEDYFPCVGLFAEKKVKAFQPEMAAKRYVEVLEYDPETPSNSVVCLTTHDKRDQVFIMGGYVPGQEEAMVARIAANHWPRATGLAGSDELIIPEVKLSVSRNYTELVGLALQNPALPSVFLADMQDEVSFTMNYEGVKFLNQARIIATRGMPPPPKEIIFDAPFLVVLKQTYKPLPYLVIGIGNDVFLNRIRSNRQVGHRLKISR